MNVSFFDLLGIAPDTADPVAAARTLLKPLLAENGIISLTQGINVTDDSVAMIGMLAELVFTDVRPGVDPHAALGASGAATGQIGVAASVTVTGPLATQQPFYLRALPDHGIQLAPTDPQHPASLFFVLDGRGTELIIDRLPVRIFLKSGIASVLTGTPTPVGSFDPTDQDSFAYTLGDDAHPAEIDCFIRLHLLPGNNEVILEPSVPISFGPVRWMGLPAAAVYDIQLIPAPDRREYFEWAHNDIGAFISNPPAAGALAFRSIDLDFSQPPFSDLRTRLQQGGINLANLELVMEDVVLPVSVPVLPVPSHGIFGFRRKITDRTDIGQAYSLSGAPVIIPLYTSGQQGGSGGTALTLQIEQFFFQTGDVHAIDPADQPQIQFQAEIIYQSATGTKQGATMGIDAEWTLTAGWVIDVANTPAKFTIADTTVGLVGLKLGISVGRLAQGDAFKDSFEFLGDIFVTAKATGSDTSAFKLRSLTGKQLSIVAKDIGYKLGHLSLDGLQFPDGMQIIFYNTVTVIIEEMGWVEEPNGTPYFSFSGGVNIGFGGGQKTQPSGNAGDNNANGFGIRVRRLRFRTNDDASQPLFKIDGIFLKLKFTGIDIEGFGYISDYTDSGWDVKEWGFGVKVSLGAIGMTWSLSAEFVKGVRRSLPDGTQHFDYFLAAAELSYLPAGPIGLYDIRALVADNMAPNLDSTFPDGEGMALLKWHQSHDNALNMPASRTLADWIAEQSALALGVGCGFSLNGCGSAAHLSVFIFFAKSDADTGLLIVGDLFIWQNPKPIAFVAIEYDISSEKFGIMAGVNLTAGDLTSGAVPDWLANIATLTGNLYFGNQPWEFAIGQLADQTTWLGVRVDWEIWITVKFTFALALQITDGGPKGVGFVVTASGGANWGIGSFVVWGSVGFIIGTWKTGSLSTGAEIWIQLGFKINLFFVFSFGADISLKLTYLGKHPWYLTLHAEIRIDTPWFLPDVTFTVDKTWNESLPFDTSTITQSLSSASGVGQAAQGDQQAQADQPLLVPGLAGALGDASHLYTFNQLNGMNGTRIPDPHLRDDIPVVSVDTTIAISLAQPCANDSLVANSTYDGTTDTGVQQVQDLTVRYGLESVAVRRAPRYGPTAGVWTDFITDAQTGFSVGGVAPESLTFAWDVDTRADGKLAPKRLLVNSSAPYSFATQGAQNDQQAVASDPDFPCCGTDRRHHSPTVHVLDFSQFRSGTRVPRSQQFTNNGAWWTWATPNPPVAADGSPAYPGTTVAWLFPLQSVPVGAVDLLDPAAQVGFELAWDAFPGVFYLEAYDGTQLIDVQSADLHTAGSVELMLTAAVSARGMSRLTARIQVDKEVVIPSAAAAAAAAAAVAGIGTVVAAYITMADYRQYVTAIQRCGNQVPPGPPGSDASGKLAWLPNHDYEIVVSSSVAMTSKDNGTRTLGTAEALYFRTKGLPGLNACASVGDDIRQHVDTSYPARRATPLYRQEPCVLAFDNSLSSVLPIDRNPAPGDPPEKAQMFPLELNVDRVASLSGMRRLTVPGNDWILAHRANPYPPIYVVAEPAYATSTVRLTRSTDPLVLRYEAVRAAVPGCPPPTVDHASQVLLHEPIDENGMPGLWEAGTGYRATVRQEAGPFTERTGFDVFDLGAFIMQADGAAATLWSVDAAGNLVAPSAGRGRSYASCGDLDWDHLQVQTWIDLAGAGGAGIAVGVGAGTPVPQGVLATVEKDGGGYSLVLRIRNAAGETEAGRAAVAVTGPFLLSVVAYDDVVRAAVGTVSLDAPRGAVREGRVALVAEGPAKFAGIAVTALDIYSFEYVTSKYASFAEHIASYDGLLPAMAAGAFGGAPVPVGTVLTQHAGDITAAMAAAADPQQRQRLFDAITAALGFGLRKYPTAVSVTRLTDQNGTLGLVVESPEPISLSREVALKLIHHVRVWVPAQPVPLPRPRPFPVPVLALSGGVLVTPDPAPDPVAAALSSLTFAADQVTAPASLAGLDPGAELARVVAVDGGGTRIDIYEPPARPAAPSPTAAQLPASGARRQSLTAAQAARQPAYAALAQQPAGTVAVVRPGGGLGPVVPGHWIYEDVVVPVTALTDGDESRILLLSSTPLAAGSYSLDFVLDRDRWPVSVTSADPEQHYHDQGTIPLTW